MEFYNTTNEKGQILLDFTEKAISQEQQVLQVFQNNPGKQFTWTDVQNHLPQINEISLKRSITDLKNDNLLIKTNEKGTSKYGRPAYKYMLNS